MRPRKHIFGPGIAIFTVCVFVFLFSSCNLFGISMSYDAQKDDADRVIHEVLKRGEETYEHTIEYDDEGRVTYYRSDGPGGSCEARYEYSEDGQRMKETAARSSEDAPYAGCSQYVSGLLSTVSSYSYYPGFEGSSEFKELHWKEMVTEAAATRFGPLAIGSFQGGDEAGVWYFSPADSDNTFTEQHVIGQVNRVGAPDIVPFPSVETGSAPDGEKVIISANPAFHIGETVTEVDAVPYSPGGYGLSVLPYFDPQSMYFCRMTCFDGYSREATNTFDDEDRLVSSRTEDSDGQWDSTVIEYETAAEGPVTKTRKESSDGFRSDIVEKYDHSGRTIYRSEENSDGRKSEAINRYDDNGNTVYHKATSSDGAWEEYERAYDAGGNKIREKNTDKDGSYEERTYGTVDPSGKEINCLSSRSVLADGSWTLVSYGYDSSGNLCSERTEDSSGHWEEKSFAYLESGRLEWEKTTQSDGSWTKTSYSYDDLGKISREYIEYSSGEWYDTKYTYDERGNLIDSLTAGSNGETDHCTYSYDESDRILSYAIEFSDDDWLRVNYSYDENGRKSFTKEYEGQWEFDPEEPDRWISHIH